MGSTINSNGAVSSQHNALDPSLVGAWTAQVERSSSVVIGTHLNPDGDALGSALAVSHYLDQIGVENEVLCHHPAPKNLRFLPGVGRVRQVPKHEKHDLAIVVDLDAIDRLGDTAPYLQACDRMIVVDHHIPHEAPGTLRIVDTSAPATSVILTRLLLALPTVITPAMATCLLTGIVTDTGSFRFRNTTAEALDLAAKLLICGGDINLVSEEIFQSKPVASARLLGLALETMRLEEDSRIAWAAIHYYDFLRIEARDEDTEGFVNEFLSIDSVMIAAIAREPKPGKVRVSLRSRAAYDVAAVARQFGGGGHKNAAGCTFDGDIESTMQLIIPSLRKCLASS